MTGNSITLFLGLLMFSFFITSIIIVPFINILYKFKLTRRKQAPKTGDVHIFDKLHDKKAGTPIGGGILIIAIVSLLFFLLFPFASHMGVYIRSAYDFRSELRVIFLTFLSFGAIGLSDDLVKIFGKPSKGRKLLHYGLTDKQKFILQWIFGGIIAYMLYSALGISIIYIPLLGLTIDLGLIFVPFAAFIIVFFSNALNITDGLDGLSVGLLAIFLVAFGVIAASSLDTPLSFFIALWLGSIMAFLYFNVWPARIFLGDAGALSFGAMMGVIGLLTGGVVALFVIGGIFVLELASSAIQIFGWRIMNKPIFPVAPLHHTFEALGWEEPKIVMRAWLAGIMLAIFGLWLATI